MLNLWRKIFLNCCTRYGVKQNTVNSSENIGFFYNSNYDDIKREIRRTAKEFMERADKKYHVNGDFTYHNIIIT